MKYPTNLSSLRKYLKEHPHVHCSLDGLRCAELIQTKKVAFRTERDSLSWLDLKYVTDYQPTHFTITSLFGDTITYHYVKEGTSS